ncbi:conserved hypothetical protein [Burkholderia sp. 8Y]|uniref:hypothetical protein n=1 Tax=Burkholderia sp. 8Y TaxID=2653133 RepID=UPI0012F28E7D|nr:hypothetical protein [Burkholderia sp. 8Y]VXC70964.1 conserved hypothetical protein [Burkholderia sp. 8Y]
MTTDTPTSFPLLPRSISVMVSGHRRKRKFLPFRTDLHRAFATLDTVLEKFAQIQNDGARADASFPPELYDRGPTTIRVITGHADRVDRHAIRKAGDLDLRVNLIVPDEFHGMTPDKPERSVSFGCPHSVSEKDNAPFATRDEFALSYADILVVVWDGDTPPGAPGGVVWLIQQAVAMGLPVLWIDLQGHVSTIADHRVTELWLHRLKRTTLEQGLLAGLFEAYDIDNGVLIDSLRRRLNPFDAGLVSPSLQTDVLRSYATETHGSPLMEARVGWFEQFMTSLFRVRPCDFVNSLSRLVLGTRTCKQKHETSEASHSGPLAARFDWSDARANVAGRRHGSATWLLYMLSSAAVFASVAGIEQFGRGRCFWFSQCSGDVKTVWPWIELALVLIILYSFVRAGRLHWHRLWLGHRFVAEQIRYLQMLEPFLAVPAPFNEPLITYHQGHYRLRNAELWLLQRSLSAGGFPALYETYRLASQSVPERGRRLEEAVELQFVFHRKKHKAAHSLHRRMELCATVLFGVAALCTVSHIAAHLCESWPVCTDRFEALLPRDERWLSLFSASLPALGAALHGVMTKLEFGRIAEQSNKVQARLEVLLSEVRFTMTRPDLSGWQPMADLRHDACEIAELLGDENVQWRDLINYQRTELP